MRPRYLLTAVLLFFAPAVLAQDDSTFELRAGGILSGTMRFSAPRTLHGSQVIADAPYSGEETYTTVQTLADGTHITQVNSTGKLYRDSAGRTHIERPAMQFPPGAQHAEIPVVVTITDPVAHVQYTLDTVNKIAHKQALTDAPRAPARQTTPRRAAISAPTDAPAAEGPQTTQAKLDSREIDGLSAEGTRTTTVYPVDYWGNDRPITVVIEDWHSPELKIDVLHTENDPRTGEVTRKMSIVRGEPDASLFRPSADYSIVEEQGDFTIQWGGAKGRAQ